MAQISEHRPMIGVFWMLVTGLLFVGVTAVVRLVGADIPAAQSAFIRYAIGVILVAPILWRVLRHGVSGQVMQVYVFRGFVHMLAVVLWFFAMVRIPLAEVTAIGYTTPIYITIGAALFLGERLQRRRIAAIIIAFLGALLILRPGLQEISIGQIGQVGAALGFAASYLTAKRLTHNADAAEIVAMLSVLVTLFLLPFALWVWVPPTVGEVLGLGVVAILATLAHYTMTLAMQAAPITVTQPVTFLQLVWASLLGYFAFDEAVDVYVLIGGGIIISAVTFISYRESTVKRTSVTPPAGLAKL